MLVFFNNILIYSCSTQEHLQHLEVVLSELRAHKLYANAKKCMFEQHSVEYLGHIVSVEGVSVDRTKVSTMLDWPTLKTLKELRGLLGLTGYYQKFVRGYGMITWPLTDQLKKDNFHWGEAKTKACSCIGIVGFY